MFSIASQIWSGKTLARALLNKELSHIHLEGLVVDIGGRKNSNYLSFVEKAPGTEIVSIDYESQTGKRIDLEIDDVPFETKAVEGVLMLNLLEHVYNYHHVVSEAARILKPQGQFIGYAPFLVRYHPDPEDFFRYTKTSLRRILQDCNFTNIKVKELGSGPFFVIFNTLMLFFPRPLRVLFWYPTLLLNSIYLRLRPDSLDKYPLGYMFYAEGPDV